MADKDSVTEAVDAAEGDDQLPKKGLFGNKLVLIGLVIILLAVGGGVYMLFFTGGSDISTVEADLETEADELKASNEEVVFLELPAMTSNLSTVAGEPPVFVKMLIALECPDSETMEAVVPLMPRVLDSLNVFLREVRPNDLNGSAGVFRIKEELLRRVNNAIQPYKINQVLFKEFLVQ